MSFKNFLKLLWRSKSISFARDKNKPGRKGIYTFGCQPIHYRSQSSDQTLIHDILLYRGPKAEYWIPKVIEPKIILDIGANIGIASLYFANYFPEATILSVEPLPDNFILLEKNTSAYKQIRTYNTALGPEDGKWEMNLSANKGNFGGASFYGVGVDEKSALMVDVLRPSSFFNKTGLTQIDVIKIDTEGAEYDILTSIDEITLSKVKWIIGELHGINDFLLLDYLSRWFHIDVRKTLHKRYFRFNACNRNFIDQINKSQIKWLQY